MCFDIGGAKVNIMGKYEKIISHDAKGTFYINTLKTLNIIGGVALL